MNEEIRELYNTIIATYNMSNAPIEAKRLIAESVCYMLSQKADEIIVQEINQRKDNEDAESVPR